MIREWALGTAAQAMAWLAVEGSANGDGWSTYDRVDDR